LKKIVVLGSTGSIGGQAMQVIKANPGQFRVLALSAGSNARLLLDQAARFGARYVGLADEAVAKACESALPPGCGLFAGANANEALAALPEADIVLNSIAGIQGLPALLAALNAGKTVALANKESIICGNKLVKEAIRAHGGSILPVDSEHSAIFQCLQRGAKSEVAALHLTASGGPFWRMDETALCNVTVADALRHPVWRMGKNISIDSATLMNKGLEVIEAQYLFDVDKIEVLIHPQSIVHSLVEYIDGAVIAQLSVPDMRLAIQYALTYPARAPGEIKRLSLPEVGRLQFYNGNDFPAIRLAREALLGGECLPIVYCAANGKAVELFLEGKISFADIIRSVTHAMQNTPHIRIHALADIEFVMREARRHAAAYFGQA
jgi:1-deoxy-D-xylulose-5-phosphate reductoisomerase